jgi:hypothetical protein
MATARRLGLGELDPPTLNPIHNPHMHPIGADDFHMLADTRKVRHDTAPWLLEQGERVGAGMDAGGEN